MEIQALISISDLFKKSFEIYKNKALLMGTLMLIPLLACVAGGILLLPFIIAFVFSDFNTIFLLLGILVLLLIVLAWLAVNLLCWIAPLYCLKENMPVTINNVKGLLLKAWSVLGSYVWIKFLVGLSTLPFVFAWIMLVLMISSGNHTVYDGLVLVLLFFLFIVLGIVSFIFFTSRFVFVNYTLIFERKKGISALMASKQLMKGYWWRVFGRFLLLCILLGILSWIPLFGALINLLVAVPFATVCGYVIYEDLKRIKS